MIRRMAGVPIALLVAALIGAGPATAAMPGSASGSDTASLAGATLATPLHAVSVPVADGVPQRIGGTDRYQTAALLAQQFGSANAVIVANGSTAKGGFDALSANYLAGQLGAPIVLTGGEALERRPPRQ